MSSMDWRTLQGLLLPEGRVRQVRRGGTPIWTCWYSLLHGKLENFLHRSAQARSLGAAPAQADLPLADTEALGAAVSSSAAEAVQPCGVMPETAANAFPASAAGTENQVELSFFAVAWSKARSLGASEVRFAKDMEAASVSRGSAPAASEQNYVLTIASEAHGPAVEPGRAERETEFILAAKSAAPTALPAGADGAVRMEPHTTGKAQESAAAQTVHSAAPDCECTLTNLPSQAAGAVLPMLNCTASVRLAESWVYPTVLGWGCICPLTRVSRAQLYETRAGGNGLELS